LATPFDLDVITKDLETSQKSILNNILMEGSRDAYMANYNFLKRH